MHFITDRRQWHYDGDCVVIGPTICYEGLTRCHIWFQDGWDPKPNFEWSLQNQCYEQSCNGSLCIAEVKRSQKFHVMNNTAAILNSRCPPQWLSGHVRRLPEGIPAQGACKCLLNCSRAPHQSLIGGESHEDYKAAGCLVFTRKYISLHKRPGQRLQEDREGWRAQRSFADYALMTMMMPQW